jgi:hypothetical protein
LVMKNVKKFQKNQSLYGYSQLQINPLWESFTKTPFFMPLFLTMFLFFYTYFKKNG